MTSAYTSSELTHFVGRACSKDDERYDLLIKILRGGQLRAGGISGISTDSAARLAVTGNMKISDETAIQGQIVCFCDIPIGSLDLHMSKYSQFGVAFSKPFLVAKGANPVFYVARDAVLPGISTVPTGTACIVEPKHNVTLADRLDSIHAEAMELSTQNLSLVFGSDNPTVKDHLVRVELLRQLLYQAVLAFIKPFDSTEPEESKNNFYMEREWRVFGDVFFQLEDVCRVILPPSYVDRFKNDFPDFRAELTPSTPDDSSDQRRADTL